MLADGGAPVNDVIRLYGAWLHTRRKAKDRYGIELSWGRYLALVCRCRERRWHSLVAENEDQVVCRFQLDGLPVMVVYVKVRDVILTALPPRGSDEDDGRIYF